jgi:lysophospholipase L1-like esterase
MRILSNKFVRVASLMVILLFLVSLKFITQPFFYELHFSPKPDHAANPPTPDYRIVFVGDSMTEKLGNFDELHGYLKKYFPNRTFLLLNYGFGSTPITSVPERLEKDSTHSARIFEPINNIDFNLILLESMGHNPLSELPLNEGLKKQNETLDQIIASITKKHPKESIIFVATIAPNKAHYGEGLVDLSVEKRAEWANERNAYIENHIKYAKDHNIPLIDIYHKSLTNGDGNLDYIDNKDHIHPSATGVYLISKEIADFLKTKSSF